MVAPRIKAADKIAVFVSFVGKTDKAKYPTIAARTKMVCLPKFDCNCFYDLLHSINNNWLLRLDIQQ